MVPMQRYFEFLTIGPATSTTAILYGSPSFAFSIYLISVTCLFNVCALALHFNAFHLNMICPVMLCILYK